MAVLADLSTEAKEPQRTRAYLRWLIERGHVERFGYPLDLEPEHIERVMMELGVIERQGFCSYFLILASIMDFCRREKIPYGPGRGSVGGSFVAYLCGIHEVNSLEWGLIFERFMTPDRVSYPDVDLDFSQVHRERILNFVRDTYEKDGTVVLRVGAFRRAGGRATIDNVCAAMRQREPETADQTAFALKGCLPEKGTITGGVKVPRELEWWLENGHGDKTRFEEIMDAAGWRDMLMKLDGMYTHLTSHAAGVVILSQEDVKRMPRVTLTDSTTKEKYTATGFDMYDLDNLGVLKYDILGLRTLDVISEAHRFIGGSGETRDLLDIWREHRDDPEPYPMLTDGDTLGIFQMETSGYRRTLKQFKPTRFDHIVQLNALYRPGAIDYKLDDGRNMVDLFIDRHNGREAANPPAKELTALLRETHGVFLYQEQAMEAVRILAGFTATQADQLRKGIGKKIRSLIDELKPAYFKGCEANNIKPAIAARVWENIMAAARYSWNKAHAVEYAAITWLTLWFKFHHPAAFYAALFNSYDDDKDKLAEALAEARQRVKISPPNINVAKGGFVVSGEEIIFGLNGIKGMGESGRNAILHERETGVLPFGSFGEFCRRMVDEDGKDTLAMDKKRALIRCGAFDELDDRGWLLATCPKPGKGSKCAACEGMGSGTGPEGQCEECGGEGYIPKIWDIAEAINHNRKLKKPRELPNVWEVTMPTDAQLSQGEVEAIGFYISAAPLEKVAKALTRVPKGNHIGGEIERIQTKTDKNGGLYARLTILTPALTKQPVIIFASNWPLLEWIEKGMQVIMRGKHDGSSFLADSVFKHDDMRHFKVIETKRDGKKQQEPFNGEFATVVALEQAGYRVRLL